MKGITGIGLICLALSSIGLNTYSQATIGISEVVSIESKSEQITANKNSITIQKENLLALEDAWRKKIELLRNELASLYKERDELIADMKVGAKCSKCGKYKSELEKGGINFETHLGEVKGYAIPATTEELESVRSTFRDKIAYKKVQIQNLENGDNAIINKKKEIKGLEEASEKLCKEITDLSKVYENKLFSEAKSKHEIWTSDLMNYVTSILISDDKIAINRARLIRYEREFQKESEEAKQRVKEENEAEQKSAESKIADQLQQIEGIKSELNDYVQAHEPKLSELKKLNGQFQLDINSLSVSDSVKTVLRKDQQRVVEQLNSLEKLIREHRTSVQNKIAGFENDNKRLNDQIFQLKANLTKRQATEIVKVKVGYDQKKSAANQAIMVATSELANARKAYNEKLTFYKSFNDLYHGTIVTECNRMVIAGQKVACSVWNEIRFMVMTNWNQVLPCVTNVASMAKPYSGHVFNSYCTGKSSSTYLSAYRNFILGLDPDDQEAIKANSNSDWFESITK